MPTLDYRNPRNRPPLPRGLTHLIFHLAVAVALVAILLNIKRLW
jgi:hypothetical protein